MTSNAIDSAGASASLDQAESAYSVFGAIKAGVTSGAGLTTPVWIAWLEVRIGLVVALCVGVYWIARAGAAVVDLVRKCRS